MDTDKPDLPVIERGTEEGEAPQWTFASNRPNLHTAVVKKTMGDETNFSAVQDLEGKLLSLESGLLHRFALARWLDRKWREGNHGSVLLQVGQLRRRGTDTNGTRRPICYFEEGWGFLLLRFEGRRSNLLLVMPDNSSGAFLTAYPYFACVSQMLWGKEIRGVTAEWHVGDGNITIVFNLSLGLPVHSHLGVLETHTYTFTGTLIQQGNAFNGKAGTPASQEPDNESESWGVYKYNLSTPEVNVSRQGVFALTSYHADLVHLQPGNLN